jgi:hypothetical protein
MITPFTFGIEFELTVATLDDHNEDPHPLDPRPVKGLKVERPSLAIDPDLVTLSDWEDPPSPFATNKFLHMNITSKLREAGLPAAAKFGIVGVKGDGNQGIEYDKSDSETKWRARNDVSIQAPTDKRCRRRRITGYG